MSPHLTCTFTSPSPYVLQGVHVQSQIMAPDRGDREHLLRGSSNDDYNDNDNDHDHDHDLAPQNSVTSAPIGHEPDAAFLARQSEQPQFTLRALVAGTLIGVLIAFSNTYFGLQTGWISGMAMPSALIGFAYFKGLRTMSRAVGGRLESLGLGKDFSEVENVLVQTVAGSVGTMPLGCGFVGVVPALEFLLKPSETPPGAVFHAGLPEIDGLASGGIHLSLAKLILWALGLCFFGVVFAVPLRKEVIIREKLKFPSGTATALMIGVLHGGEKTGVEGEVERHAETRRRRSKMSNSTGDAEAQAFISDAASRPSIDSEPLTRKDSRTDVQKKDWQQQIRLLTTSFGISGAYVRTSQIVTKTSYGLALMVSDRLSRPISCPNFTLSLSWVFTCLRSGYGISTRVQHMLAKASLWVLRPLYTCCLGQSSAGPFSHL